MVDTISVGQLKVRVIGDGINEPSYIITDGYNAQIAVKQSALEILICALVIMIEQNKPKRG